MPPNTRYVLRCTLGAVLSHTLPHTHVLHTHPIHSPFSLPGLQPGTLHLTFFYLLSTWVRFYYTTSLLLLLPTHRTPFLHCNVFVAFHLFLRSTSVWTLPTHLPRGAAHAIFSPAPTHTTPTVTTTELSGRTWDLFYAPLAHACLLHAYHYRYSRTLYRAGFVVLRFPSPYASTRYTVAAFTDATATGLRSPLVC